MVILNSMRYACCRILYIFSSLQNGNPHDPEAAVDVPVFPGRGTINPIYAHVSPTRFFTMSFHPT